MITGNTPQSRHELTRIARFFARSEGPVTFQQIADGAQLTYGRTYWLMRRMIVEERVIEIEPVKKTRRFVAGAC